MIPNILISNSELLHSPNSESRPWKNLCLEPPGRLVRFWQEYTRRTCSAYSNTEQPGSASQQILKFTNSRFLFDFVVSRGPRDSVKHWTSLLFRVVKLIIQENDKPVPGDQFTPGCRGLKAEPSKSYERCRVPAWTFQSIQCPLKRVWSTLFTSCKQLRGTGSSSSTSRSFTY